MATRARKTATRIKKNVTTASPSIDVGLEKRVLAFAEFAGRIAGTVQARTEGFLDRNTLTAQLSTVRDGAASLLGYLGATAEPPATTPTLKPGGDRRKKRSGGTVDAPGKKHRKPVPNTAESTAAKRQTAKMRDAMTMVKTNRRRGRG